MQQVLHVGCGRKSLKTGPRYFQDSSWSEIRLDIDPDVQPDVVGSITDLGAIGTGSVDAVVSSHNLEHLHWFEVPIALAEFHRVLKNDGFVWIRCPDIQAVAREVVADRLLDTLYVSSMGPIRPIDVLFGHSRSIEAGNSFMAHRCGFTRRTLLQALLAARFEKVVIGQRPLYELVALGTKVSIGNDEAEQRIARLLT